jgi:histone H3/H4
MKEVKKYELANAPVKRLMKKTTPNCSIGNGSVERLKKELEDYAALITVKAYKTAKTNGRKTIQPRDITLAIEKLDLENEEKLIKEIEKAGNCKICIYCRSPNTRIIDESDLGLQYLCNDCYKKFASVYQNLYRTGNKRAFARLLGGC